jgi:hypothetical protein
MGMLSAKFNDEDDRKLKEICAVLGIDKSEALRRATQQFWLALQIGKPFLERAGGRPNFLLNSSDSNSSQRGTRKVEIAAHLNERAASRRKSKASKSTES